ncbi:MAG: hypothetical protein HOL01_13025 [Planctomycetaceae bacterium]|jgi:hypothetical protein|nr:hypothetical protein [Planctomycetaceae bacterium]MBT6484621.1 hypothetical protein [Planctomycetaceae bacterium]MBT6495466.1 hypothetical protein [Planctomycetaceae bacterium]
MAKWPEMLAVASKFQGKPIAFIAVNSGTPRGSVASYLRQNRVTWPTIVDADRSFETRCGVPTISLKSIWQIRIVSPDGQMTFGNPNDLQATAERALVGAKWNIDPAEIPKLLQPSWAAVEFGNYSAAAVSLKRYLKARKPEDNAAAERLQEYVVDKLDEQVELAATALKDERNWDAYKAYNSIQITFRGFEVPADIAQNIKTLRKDDAVKLELAALKRLKAASRSVARAKTPTARERGLKSLQRIIDDQPETEAAAQAKSLLEETNGTATP